MARGNKKFGEALLVGRLMMSMEARKSIRLKEVAKKLGVSACYVAQMEQGNKLPNIAMLRKIRKVYPKGTLTEVHKALGIE